MIPDYSILELRATAFMQQIPYNSDSLAKILPLFEAEGFLPSMLQQPSIQIGGNLAISPFSNWELVTFNKEERIIFGTTKIDVIRRVALKANEQEEEVRFCQQSSERLIKIVHAFNSEVTRLAFAPSYVYDLSNSDEITKMANTIFCKGKFKDSEIANCSFSNVYRVTEKIEDKDILINFVSKFFNGNKIEARNGQNSVINCIYFDMDINTYVNPIYKFPESSISFFFSKISEWNNEFMKFYFE